MLFKDRRTDSSFLNAVAKHLSGEGDWEFDVNDIHTLTFGTGDWSAIVDYDDFTSGIDSIELMNGEYTQEEIFIVEKAISLLEGMHEDDNVKFEVKHNRKRRGKGNRDAMEYDTGSDDTRDEDDNDDRR